MALNKICKGDRMEYTNGTAAAISAGAPVLVSKLLGVALTDIAVGDTGVLDLDGVYELRKANGAINQGDNLYFDADGNPQGAATGNGLSGTGCLTTTAEGNVYAGKAYAAAGTTDAYVQIKLNV